MCARVTATATRAGTTKRAHASARPTLPTPSAHGQNARGMPVSDVCAGRRRREAGPRRPRPPTGRGGTREADDYYAEHGAFLGDADFVWGPEGWREDERGLLGAASRAAGCSRSAPAPASAPAGWPRQGARGRRHRPVGRDAARRGSTAIDAAHPARRVPARPVRRPWRCRSPTRAFDTRLHGLRRRAVRRRHGAGDARGRPGAAARRAVGLLDDPPDPLGLPRRPGPRRADRDAVATSTARPTSRATPTGRRPTSSTTARSATGSARSSRPGCVLVDLVEPEWPERNEQAVGRLVARCAGGCFPGTAIFVCRPASLTSTTPAAR